MEITERYPEKSPTSLSLDGYRSRNRGGRGPNILGGGLAHPIITQLATYLSQAYAIQ